ncbi:HAD family hydrolase [Flavicella sp.]|jgi:putative hydrolase of the HAD superfamily|nr:HAD family hydrolase [Flavicella sp.]MDA9111463.1 HAD family hydrolase [Flavicella sp.]
MEINPKKIKVIAFDADDTLWTNEPYFREAEQQVAQLLTDYETTNKIHQELYKIEIDNLGYYGYGVKGFILSMIELALDISNEQISPLVLSKILEIGKDMLGKPIELLEGVKEVLDFLHGDFKLIVATKGDLLDQERKLEKSGLLDYFHHVEVMSDKKEADYMKIIKHLEIEPSELLMVGNSLRSDVLPLLAIGAAAVHVPYHTTWMHEQVSEAEDPKEFYKTLHQLVELKNYFS